MPSLTSLVSCSRRPISPTKCDRHCSISGGCRRLIRPPKHSGSTSTVPRPSERGTRRVEFGSLTGGTRSGIFVEILPRHRKALEPRLSMGRTVFEACARVPNGYQFFRRLGSGHPCFVQSDDGRFGPFGITPSDNDGVA